MKRMMSKLMFRILNANGLILGALSEVVESMDKVPEFQRGWYVQGEGGKFKLDLSKVEVEDVTGLKNTVAATRAEAAKARKDAEDKVREALKAYDGIDPVKTRELLSKFDNQEEAALIAAGKIDEVISRRMEKARAAFEKQVADAKAVAESASTVANTFMERVLDNHVRAAAAAAGLQTSAIDDALLRARAIFSLNEDGDPVQLDKDDNVVLGKDGKTPFTPAEWLESMKEKAPHWFPASASGGGSGGSKNKGGGPDLSGLTPTQRLTAARSAKK